jgi:hypothetical protein
MRVRAMRLSCVGVCLSIDYRVGVHVDSLTPFLSSSPTTSFEPIAQNRQVRSGQVTSTFRGDRTSNQDRLTGVVFPLSLNNPAIDT